MEYFICVLGMVFVIEGLPYFGFPDQMKRLMSVMQEQDDSTLRILGAAFMFLGAFLVFIARHGMGAQ